MTIRELKQQILKIQKGIPYDIFLENRPVGWSISANNETTELYKIVKEDKRKRIYFVTNLDYSHNDSFLAKLRKINNLTFGRIFNWASKSSKDDNYEVYVAFKYEFKDEDVYDYGLCGENVKVDYQKNETSRLILSPKEKSLSKVKLHGLDECLKQIIESLEKDHDED